MSARQSHKKVSADKPLDSRKGSITTAVTLKNSRYQPSRKQLRQDVTIKASPLKIMRSVLRTRPVRFEE